MINIVQLAEQSGAIIIKFGMQNEEATQYIFVKANLDKFSKAIIEDYKMSGFSEQHKAVCKNYGQS